MFIPNTTSKSLRVVYKISKNFGAWLDRKTHLPYKGYSRLRTRRWNLKNTTND